MLIAIFVTFIITFAIGLGLRTRSNGLIGRRPYSNRYNDAAGAREEF